LDKGLVFSVLPGLQAMHERQCQVVKQNIVYFNSNKKSTNNSEDVSILGM